MTLNSPVWHPFTQHAVQGEMPTVVKNEGAWLTTADGHQLFDAISSWWVVTHGHRHPQIMQAIKAQSDLLDQIIFAGFTHPPAEELARQLVAITPPELQYVFFSDSGSTSVEVALKMALGFWLHSGEDRRRILALEGAYHGDTIGGMSVGERGVFNQPYRPLLFDVARLPFPAEGAEQATLNALEQLCAQERPAAFIVEPLVLGAGGMRIYSAATLREMRAMCAKHDVLFIADEVMTGWGRTGTLLACEQADIVPDILCLSKGITGGALPLAVTIATDPIFDAHRSANRADMFFHSSSYTANPIACAAANANLAIWREEPVQERIRILSERQAAHLAQLCKLPAIRNPRQIGTITAFELESPDGDYLSDLAPWLMQHFREHDLLVRPLGNTIYTMPPYCIDEPDLDRVYSGVIEAIDRFIETGGT